MSVLDEIVANTRAEVARRKVAVPRAALERQCDATPATRDFEAAVRPSTRSIRLIAEVKKASPSRACSPAVSTRWPSPPRTRRTGHAISVLTDEKYFQGSLDDLRRVRAAVEVPLLRKDFTIDEYQLWESRAAGADAVLLIVSILEPARLAELLAAAKGLGLPRWSSATRPPRWTRRSPSAAASSDQQPRSHTFETRISTTIELLPLIRSARSWSARALFHRRRRPPVAAAGATRSSSAKASSAPRTSGEDPRADAAAMTRVKICGITNLEDAMTAVEAAPTRSLHLRREHARFVTPKSCPIVRALPPFVTTVGIFWITDGHTKAIAEACGSRLAVPRRREAEDSRLLRAGDQDDQAPAPSDELGGMRRGRRP